MSSPTMKIIPKVIRIDLADIHHFLHYRGILGLLCTLVLEGFLLADFLCAKQVRPMHIM